MPATPGNPPEAFAWKPQERASAIVRRMESDVLAECREAADLAQRMREQTGTRFIDWVDYFVWPDSPELNEQLNQAGFAQRTTGLGIRYYQHERGMFPRVLLGVDQVRRVAIKVESVADFVFAWPGGIDASIQGLPLEPVRRARVDRSPAELWAIERHGHRGFEMLNFDAETALRVLEHQEALRLRQRRFESELHGFDHLDELIGRAVRDLGADRACDIFFTAEREFWQSRNRAAQAQKARQDRLGLGWANHDHHTYRSSRRYFTRLIAALEQLGFHSRERFYAGKQAGWGAQIMEQPEAGIVVFADVDLAPEEVLIDFAHEPLSDRKQLGTVGLWCALHGEAILEAGMHHLECQFDFESLRKQLEEEDGVRMMKPFTDLPYLRQAFTEGQRWPVREERIDRLLQIDQITPEQARQFRENGAIGSHLENLQRDQGFKGFNQAGVSEIIAATDPRKHSTGTVHANS